MNTDLPKTLRKSMKEMGLSEGELSRRSGVPQPTVHRILTGESRDPRRSNLEKIGKSLGLTVPQLLGESPLTSNTSDGPQIQGRVPLISWVQAGEFCEAIDLFQPGDAEEWLPCPANHSDSSYALRVRGASMEPRFHEDEIIIIDPDVSADPGRFVIARKEGDKTVTFKKLVTDGADVFLEAINPNWPERYIKFTEEWKLCGVVICKMELF